MQFEYTPTVADIQELEDSKSGVKRKTRPVVLLLSYLLLFAVCILGALPSGTIFEVNARVAKFSATRPEQNLWVTLAPSLSVVTLCFWGLMLQAWIG